ncbi:MAG: cupin domain-containing protein [Capsulimonadales bacterium]|nr:cupin domain-containing protein [Capsulimonadales bacterium]
MRNRDRCEPFVTRDGSLIREILAPGRNPGAIRRQSLAEATLPPGRATEPHFHPVSEEIYYILQGEGEMRIGTERLDVGPSDAIAIPPGAVHTIQNIGTVDLVFLCCCAPAYTHLDTILSEIPEPTPEGSEARSDP